ncbi:hypothetical protein [Rhodococcus jostii]|uniref:hypothetical protein n=1 Tax=Rhodococcus jostii TaxID=132919 RepID=UPI00362DF014
MDIRKNNKWLRKAAYAPLAAAVLAGAVCSGAGLGSAATDTETGVGAGTNIPDPAPLRWSVVNGTGQPIYGKMKLTENVLFPPMPPYPYSTTSIERPKERPWAVGDHESTERAPRPTTGATAVYEGHICYNKKWWELPGDSFILLPNMHSSVAHLEVDSLGTLHLVENTYDGFGTHTFRTPFAFRGQDCDGT